MLRVGLTGGIACGKSRVLRALAAAGFPTLDLDLVSHQVMAPGGSAYADVVRAFSPRILGEGAVIDRKRLGAVVFSDPAARERLNAIVHPRVREAEARESAAWEAAGQAVGITDAALLVETGAHLRFDRLVVVHCPPALQLQRLRARDSLDETSARARIAAQMPIEEKQRFAHFAVDTAGTLEETDRRAESLAGELRVLGGRPPARPQVPRERILGGFVHGYREGPGGVTPTALLAAIVHDGELELPRLGRALEPPVTVPWFAPPGRAPGPSPTSLSLPLAVWVMSRRGSDAELAAAVVASVARLVGAPAEERAAAVHFALVCLTHLAGPSKRDEPALRSLAEVWGGSPAPEVLAPEARATLAGMDAGAAASEAPEAARLLDALLQ